jgi:hypothetical protein
MMGIAGNIRTLAYDLLLPFGTRGPRVPPWARAVITMVDSVLRQIATFKRST